MPDPQTVSDMLALSRWDGEGGAGPLGRQQRAVLKPQLRRPTVLSHRHDNPSTFLRTQPSERPTQQHCKRRAAAMTAIRVMVVEDETLLGFLFGEVLEGMGYVVCAIEATEASAVAAAERCKPDLMLVDVQLGVGSGVSAVAEILRNGFVPHVFYSGDISGVQVITTERHRNPKAFPCLRTGSRHRACARRLRSREAWQQWPVDPVRSALPEFRQVTKLLSPGRLSSIPRLSPRSCPPKIDLVACVRRSPDQH